MQEKPHAVNYILFCHAGFWCSGVDAMQTWIIVERAHLELLVPRIYVYVFMWKSFIIDLLFNHLRAKGVQ